MSTTSTNIDPRAKRWGLFAKYAALLVVGFVVAPYIFTAITGLVGLIVAGVIMLGAWMLAPSVEMAARNLRLKLIKGEAKRNPVETLQEDLRAKTVALDERKTAIEKLNGQIRTFADKVDSIKERYGVQDSGYLKLAADLKDLKRVAASRADKWKQAHEQLVRYAEEIDRANMIWDAGQAAAAARETSGLSEEEFFAKLKAETAFDAIQQQYNEALASLDTSLLEEPINVTKSAQQALPAADDSNVIDATVLTTSKSKVAR